MKNKYHVVFHGFVQGVGFRAFIMHNAKKLNVGGWAKNDYDGTVEAVLYGETDLVEQLCNICKVGNGYSRVKKIIKNKFEDNKDYSEFYIRY